MTTDTTQPHAWRLETPTSGSASDLAASSSGASGHHRPTQREQLLRVCHQAYLFLSWQLIISPHARLKVWWDWLLLLSVLYNTLALPFVIAFVPSFAASDTVLLLDLVTAAMMMLDMLLILRTAVTDHTSMLVYDADIIARRYLHSRAFAIDLLSTFPFFLFSYAIHTQSYPVLTANSLRLPSVLRVYRMFTSPRIAEVTASPKLRIIRFLLWFLYAAHAFACGFFFIGQQQPAASGDNWALRRGLQTASTVEQYVDSLYWALETMCTVGYGDNVPVTEYETAYVCFVLMCTGIIYAAIFGNMSNAIHALSTSARRYHSLLDGVQDFSHAYALPPALHEKLLAYANEYWKHSKGFEISDVLHSSLPHSVRAEIVSHINASLLQRVPLFRQCSPRFLSAIILKLRNMVCLQGDYLFREGDMSRELYFIRHGSVEVVQDDPTAIGEQEVVISCLTADSPHPYFGEIALLLGETRTASVRAKERSMVSLITLHDFVEVMALFPSEEDTLREVALARLHADLERMNSREHDDAAKDGKPSAATTASDSGVQPERAKQLAMLALSFMKDRAKQRLLALQAEQRRRLWQRQRKEIAAMDVERVKGRVRFKRAVLQVMAAAVEGGVVSKSRATAGAAAFSAKRRLASPSHFASMSRAARAADSPAAAAAAAVVVAAPAAVVLLPLPPQLTLSLAGSASPSQRTSLAADAHILSPQSSSPLHPQLVAAHLSTDSPANGRLRQYRSQGGVEAGAGSEGGSRQLSRQGSLSLNGRKSSLMLIEERKQNAGLLRSRTLQQLKFMVQTRDMQLVRSANGSGVSTPTAAAGEAERRPPLPVHVPSLSDTGDGAAGDASTPVSVATGSASVSRTRTEMLLMLNGHGSLKDVALGSPAEGRASLRASRTPSRRPSRPASPVAAAADGSGALKSPSSPPLPTVTTLVKSATGEPASAKGAMIAQLQGSRGKTLFSPTGSMYRASAQHDDTLALPSVDAAVSAASSLTPTAGKSGRTFTFRSAAAAGTGSAAAAASGAAAAFSSSSSSLSPAGLSSTSGLSPESAAALRVQKRRTLNVALEMAAQLGSSALPLQRPTTPHTLSTLPVPTADDGAGLEVLQALKRQRDGRQAKRRTLRDGLQALEPAAPGPAKATGKDAGSPASPAASELSSQLSPQQAAVVKRRSLLPQFWSSVVHPVSVDAAAAVSAAGGGGGAVLVSGDSLVMGGTKAGDRLTAAAAPAVATAAAAAAAAGLSSFRESRLTGRMRRTTEAAQLD